MRSQGRSTIQAYGSSGSLFRTYMHEAWYADSETNLVIISESNAHLHSPTAQSYVCLLAQQNGSMYGTAASLLYNNGSANSGVEAENYLETATSTTVGFPFLVGAPNSQEPRTWHQLPDPAGAVGAW